MNARNSLRRRPWVEELEPRVVLSAPAPLLYHATHATISTSSTNWSGYAVETNFSSPTTNSVTAVSGSWVVPAVSGTGTAYSSFWVGIDGFSSGSVEQIGTDSDIVNGVPVYYAWYEMYPNPAKSVALTINQGDTINATVAFSPSTKVYTLSLTDVTSGGSFSIGQKLAGAKNSSAEWVAEAPSSRTGVLPLANFGTAQFFNASATVNGTSGPIDGPSWQSASINMVTPSGALKATTSALAPDTTSGSSFSVAWDSSGVVQKQHNGRHASRSANESAAPSAGTTTTSNINPATAAQANAAVVATSPSVTIVSLAAPPASNNSFVPSPSSLSPVLLPLAFNGVRAGTEISDDAMDDDMVRMEIWLPANTTPVRSAVTGSFTELMTPHRQPAVVGDMVPLQAAPGADINGAAPTDGQAPASDAGSVDEGNIVTRNFSKALWLAAALGFAAHAAFVKEPNVEERQKKRA